MYAFRPLFVMLVFVGCVVAGDRPAGSLGGEDDPAARWLQRSVAHAAKMNAEARNGKAGKKDWGEKTSLSTARIVLCELYVWMDQVPEAMALVRGMPEGEPEDRAATEISLAMSLAQARKIEAAVRWAESLDTRRVPDPVFPENTNESARERSVYGISLTQALQHDFAGAKETIGRIRDPEVICGAWRRLAECQAKAGQYEDALESVAKMIPASEAAEQAKNDTLALIAQCRAERRKGPRPPIAGDYLNTLRALCDAFSDTALDGSSLEQQEAKAAGMSSPAGRASAWRQIAWAHFRTGDRQRCRNAIEKSRESAQDIPGKIGHQRALNEVLLADLCLELGDREAAIGLIRQASLSGNRDLLARLGLGTFTTAPLAISVFVRTGNVDEAIEIAQEAGEGGAMAWASLGVFCAQEGALGRIEKVLETTRSERIKAVVCAGIAYGLQRKQRTCVQD